MSIKVRDTPPGSTRSAFAAQLRPTVSIKVRYVPPRVDTIGGAGQPRPIMSIKAAGCAPRVDTIGWASPGTGVHYVLESPDDVVDPARASRPTR